jgi:hypothetical protein
LLALLDSRMTQDASTQGKLFDLHTAPRLQDNYPASVFSKDSY